MKFTTEPLKVKAEIKECVKFEYVLLVRNTVVAAFSYYADANECLKIIKANRYLFYPLADNYKIEKIISIEN